jgi:hypothetical protein
LSLPELRNSKKGTRDEKNNLDDKLHTTGAVLALVVSRVQQERNSGGTTRGLQPGGNRSSGHAD